MTSIKSTHGAYLRRAIEEGYGPPKGYAEAKAAKELHSKKSKPTQRSPMPAKAMKRHTKAPTLPI